MRDVRRDTAPTPVAVIAVFAVSDSDERARARTIAEQLLYEVGDPTAYLTPDVVADFTSALTRDNGGAYYVRGAGAGSNSTVLGTL